MTKIPTKVVLLIVDSLRYDRLSCYGYDRPTSPFLDSIAQDGYKFQRAYSTAPWTVPVHGSLFSGQLPSSSGTHRRSKSFKKSTDDCLAGALSSAGYQTGGFSANPWLSPDFRFDTGFDHFESLSNEPIFTDEDIAPDLKANSPLSYEGTKEVLNWALDDNPIKRLVNGFWKRYLDTGADVERINQAILNWISDHNNERMFIFANYIHVHDLHHDSFLGRSDLSLPSTSSRQDLTQSRYRNLHSRKVDFISEPDDPDHGSKLYDLAIRRLDEGLRRLFEKLENQINLEESLVVILGDHGECLGDMARISTRNQFMCRFWSTHLVPSFRWILISRQASLR